jgi:LuxR family maltose regulon positive regulatory protein
VPWQKQPPCHRSRVWLRAIRENPVHNLLTELLRHPPKSLHLVLAGRSDPPLPISALRALGQVTEIRTQKLSFTPAETAEFLLHVLGTEVDAATTATWQAKTEGWVAGLRLATLALGREGDVGGMLPVREWGTQEERVSFQRGPLTPATGRPPVCSEHRHPGSVLRRVV